jgi:hypothetical protein
VKRNGNKEKSSHEEKGSEEARKEEKEIRPSTRAPK